MKRDHHEEYVMSAMGRCVHFKGIQHDLCGAGINIRQLVGGPELGWAARLPCLLMDAEKCTVVCESRKLLTRDEAEAEVSKDRERMKRTLKAVAAAHDDAGRKGFKVGLGGADSMPCPLDCGGRLYYRVASVNGHMHAKCETDGCVSWME
jgi:hypothetical protein